jgi:NADPH-dependent 2,4-dienoyl-CoA reductase/sulfur reductase-like enzyme
VSTAALVSEVVRSFKANGRIVIVGASLAGLRAAEALRDEGFTGKLTLIGDEKHEPYDRPPLSKQVLKGWVPANNTLLPRSREIDAEWRLGVAATGLDRKTRNVRLANGDLVPYDRLLIATGEGPLHDPHVRGRGRAAGGARRQTEACPDYRRRLHRL